MKFIVALVCVLGLTAAVTASPLRGSRTDLFNQLNAHPRFRAVAQEVKSGSPAERILQLLDDIIKNLETSVEEDARAFRKTDAHCEEQADSFRSQLSAAQKSLDATNKAIQTAVQNIDAKTSQIAALNKTISEHRARVNKVQKSLDEAVTMHAQGAEQYAKNRKEIEDSIKVVHTILSHLSGSKITQAASSFLELDTHLAGMGFHSERVELSNGVVGTEFASLLETAVQPETAESLESQMEAEAEKLVNEAEEKAAATDVSAATGAAGGDDKPVAKEEAGRIVALVQKLLSRLQQALEREEAAAKEAEGAFHAFASKLRNQVSNATSDMDSARQDHEAAQRAIDAARSTIQLHQHSKKDAEAAVADAKKAVDQAEGTCNAYRKEFETRHKDREGDIEAARNIRQLVEEKLHGIMEKLRKVYAQASTGAAQEPSSTGAAASTGPASL